MSYHEVRMQFTNSILRGMATQVSIWEMDRNTLKKVIEVGKKFTDMYFEEDKPKDTTKNYDHTSISTM